MGRVIMDPQIRKAVYLAFVAILAACVSYGLLTNEDVTIILDLVVKIGSAGALVVAALNVAPKGRHADDGDPSNGEPDEL